MKKILVLTSTLPKNKLDSSPPFVMELAEKLSKHFKITILAPFSKGAKQLEKHNKINIVRFKYWFNKKNNLADGAILPNLKKNKLLYLQIPVFLIANFIQLHKIIKKNKIKLIHAHWIITQGLLAVIYKKTFNKNIKVLITIHGGDIFGLKKLNFLKRYVLNNCEHITVVSNAIKKELKRIKVKNTNITIAPMGVDTNKFSPKKKDPKLKKKYNITGEMILFVGRLSEKKGVKYLLEAMQKIIRETPETKLVIIGTGEMEEELKSLCKKLKIEKNIIFTGGKSKKELPKYYASTDYFIGPSIRSKSGDMEGLGLVFVEALACECLTIATDLPAIKDVIIDKKTGYLIPQKNSNKIYKLIKYIGNNQKEAKTIKKNGRKHVLKNFDWNIITKKYQKILNNL